MCPKHNKELDVLCDCGSLVCSHCVFREHRTHSHEMIIDVFEKNEIEVREALLNTKEQIKRIESSFKDLGDLDLEFIEQSCAIEHQINEHANHIVYSINQFREQLVEEVRTATNKKRKVIHLQIEEAEKGLKKMKASQTFIEKVLQTRSPQKILASKQQMLQQLKIACNEVNMELFKPIEAFDVKFEANTGNPLEGLGTVISSHLHKKLRADGEALKCAHPFEEASFQIKLIKGESLLSRLSTFMVSMSVSPKTDTSLHSLLEDESHGMLKASYMPSKCGPHKISIKIGGEEILNSPFTTHVLPFFRKVESSLSGIKVLAPKGVCVTRSGTVAVSPFSKDSGRQEGKTDYFLLLKTDGTKTEISCPSPSGIAATPDNHILVVDKRNSCIRKYKEKGRQVESGTIGAGRFRYLNRIAINKDGMVAVTEVNSASVHILNPDLTYSTEIGGDYKTPFFHPTGVAFDSQGNMYVSDCGYNKIFKLSPEYKVLFTFSSGGHKEGQVSQPMDLAIDQNNVIYVADTDNNRISVFDQTGQFLTSFGDKGTGLSKLRGPCGVVVDVTGKVYVSDTENNRVAVFF